MERQPGPAEQYPFDELERDFARFTQDLWVLKVVDDSTAPFNHVVSVLVSQLDYTLDEARDATMRVHDAGSAVVAVTSKLDAQEKASSLRRARVRTLLAPAF